MGINVNHRHLKLVGMISQGRRTGLRDMGLVQEARESIQGVRTMPAAPAPMIATFFLVGLPDIVRRAG